MKILVTGVNPVQCGHIPRLDYISFVKAMSGGLELGGHSVDVRPAVLGEKFEEYDKVVVFLASMRGFVCSHTLGALWSIHEAKSKLVLSFDDWQVPQAIGGIRSLYAEFDKFLPAQKPEKCAFSYKQFDEYPQYRQQLLEACQYLAECQDYVEKCIVPVYGGGDTGLLGIPSKNVVGINPSSFFQDWYSPSNPRPQKSNSWILAALHDHGSWLKKQKAAWEVKQFGHKNQYECNACRTDQARDLRLCAG